MSALSHIVFGTAEKMSAIKDGQSRLTILSPPYVGHHSPAEKAAEARLLERIFAECRRVTAPDGVVASYNTDFRDSGKIYLRHAVVIAAAEASGLELFAEKIRVRTFNRDIYRLGYSFILVFRRKGHKVGCNKMIPEYERDVWHFPKSQIIAGFRDAIPPEVPCVLIKNFTEAGDLVAAPCAGSGTVVIAALKMDRKASGYEIDRARRAVIRERERRFEEFFSDENIARWLKASAR